MHLEPIGTFHCREQYPYDAARQPSAAAGNEGYVELCPGQNFEQALQDLDGFDRIWLIFAFHHNEHWKPLVHPPRADRKVGVFASRAPYRPNQLGLSCVELRRIDGLRVHVGAHDLLDGTPILDIKPYIPYADSFPDAACGWLDAIDAKACSITVSDAAQAQLAWLATHGVTSIEPFLRQQLSTKPLDQQRKRVQQIDGEHWQIAYRTWRAHFDISEDAQGIVVTRICSGYTEAELADTTDPHRDKETHRAFIAQFE